MEYLYHIPNRFLLRDAGASMKFRRSAVIATLVGTAFFGTSINSSLAAEKSPFIYFATSDPFLKPGQAPTRNDITIFGGSFVKNAFGGAIQVFGADYTSNYILGATYGRDVYDLGAGFLLGSAAGAAVRFGEDDDTSGEVWAGEIEKRREAQRGGADASFLGFLGPELSVRWRGAPNLELTWQLHHRSGANGTFGDMGEGSNANTIGIRYRF
jgi:hypothetical protein